MPPNSQPQNPQQPATTPPPGPPKPNPSVYAAASTPEPASTQPAAPPAEPQFPGVAQSQSLPQPNPVNPLDQIQAPQTPGSVESLDADNPQPQPAHMPQFMQPKSDGPDSIGPMSSPVLDETTQVSVHGEAGGRGKKVLFLVIIGLALIIGGVVLILMLLGGGPSQAELDNARAKALNAQQAAETATADTVNIMGADVSSTENLDNAVSKAASSLESYKQSLAGFNQTVDPVSDLVSQDYTNLQKLDTQYQAAITAFSQQSALVLKPHLECIDQLEPLIASTGSFGDALTTATTCETDMDELGPQSIAAIESLRQAAIKLFADYKLTFADYAADQSLTALDLAIVNGQILESQTTFNQSLPAIRQAAAEYIADTDPSALLQQIAAKLE